MAETNETSADRDEQVEIFLKKRLIGRGRCQVRSSGPNSSEHTVRLQYIQWIGGYEPPFPHLEQSCTLEFDDGSRLNGHFTDVLSGARPSAWLSFAELPQS